MICWRLSKTPTLDDHLLKPGGLIFEALIRMKDAKLQDRNTYTFDPLGSYFFGFNFVFPRFFLEVTRFQVHSPTIQLQIRSFLIFLNFANADDVLCSQLKI